MFGTINTIDKLKRRSNNAISIFKKTVTDLSNTNTEITKEQELRNKQIETLKAEKKELDSIKNENETFIKKINDLIGVTLE